MTRVRFILVIAAWVSTSTGCSLLHNLQPHRLHRLNRQSAPASNAIYSVEDPIENESAIQEFMSSTSRVEVLDQ